MALGLAWLAATGRAEHAGSQPAIATSQPAATQPARGQVSVAQISAPFRRNIQGFLDYCHEGGITIVPAGTDRPRFIVREPSIPGVELDVYFCAFAPKTPEADVRRTLAPIELAFPYYNADAGLAMSDAELRFSPHGPLPDVAKDRERIINRLANRLREYRPTLVSTSRPERQ